MTLHELIMAAQETKASDIILSPDMPAAFRIDGRMRPLKTKSLNAGEIESILHQLISPENFDVLEKKRELDFAAVYDDQRFRGNAYWRAGELALALRPIPDTIPAPETLGIPKHIIELSQKSHGLILFTGAAGQGKSTSQASLINRMNETQSFHIVTVEDPIEFVHKSNKSIVDQREVGVDTLTFAEALRHMMRQNPDVIQVGEMRDRETMQAVLSVAETGHLVFSTLHTNDACQAIDRIIDVFPEAGQNQVRTQLSLVLLAIVNQRLVPSEAGPRVLASEVLINEVAVSNLIREGKTEQLYGIFDIAGTNGSCSMNRALQDLVDSRVIAQAEAEKHMVRRESRTASKHVRGR